MTFTSYAQNFEDVMLWRALSHVENGAYIDIGAQDPIIDSVSLAFHERGWRGIHVEPIHAYAELLRQQRPGDLVIQAAVGDGPPLLKFFETPGGGISTADPVIAAQHIRRGIFVREIVVPCIALSSVFDACTSADIHWLKIDAEGYEFPILRSWGKSPARPWVVVVESTIPLTQIDVHETWEPLLLQNGYRFVYFDGLNRYYISSLHPELDAAFRAPPNVFDNFALNGTSSAEFHKVIESRYQTKVDNALAQSEISQLNARGEIDHLRTNVAASSKRLARVRKRLQHFWRSLVEREQAIIEGLVREISEVRDLHAKAISRSETREQEFATWLAESESQRAVNESLVKEISEVRDLHAKAVSRSEAREQEFATRLAESESQRAVHESLVKEISEVRDLHAKAVSRSEAREQEFATQVAECESQLTQRLAELRHSETLLNESRKRESEALSAQSNLRAALGAARERVSSAEREIAVVSSQLHAMQNKIANMDNELHEVREQLIRREQLHAESGDRLMKILERVRASAVDDANVFARDKASLEHTLAALEALLTAAEGEAAVKAAEHASVELQLQRLQAYPPIRLLMWMGRIPIRAPFASEREAGASAAHISINSAFNTNVEVFSDRRTPLGATGANVGRCPPNQQSELALMAKIQHANQLLSLAGTAFVNAAYEAILGRAPDSSGAAYYLRRLQTEQDRVQILYELATSKEGRIKARTLQGLSDLILPNRLRRIPPIRWLQNLLGIGQQFVRVEAMVAQIGEESRVQLRSIETQLVSLANACERVAGGAQPSFSSATPELDRGSESLPAALDSVLTAEDGSEALLRSLAAQLGGSAQAKILSKK